MPCLHCLPSPSHHHKYIGGRRLPFPVMGGFLLPSKSTGSRAPAMSDQGLAWQRVVIEKPKVWLRN